MDKKLVGITMCYFFNAKAMSPYILILKRVNILCTILYILDILRQKNDSKMSSILFIELISI